MAYTETIGVNYDDNATPINKNVTVTGSGKASVSEAIADSETDLEVTIAIDYSALVGFYMVSDQAVTVETNDGTTPDDTFSLLADTPVVWYTGCGHANPFSADVTSVYVTNASGATANLTIIAITDATP